MIRKIITACSLLLFIFTSGSLLFAQSESNGYRFRPAYEEGEKWVVNHQIQFSSRFHVETLGKVVSRKQFNLTENRKYVKTFKDVRNNQPHSIEHFYVRADRRQQFGKADSEDVQLEEQGARVGFQRSPDSGDFKIESTSHELSEGTRTRLRAAELYRHVLPDNPVHMGSDPWVPDVSKPVSLQFGPNLDEGNTSLLPEFEHVLCELSNVREKDGRKIALISILLKTSESRSSSGDEIYARLEGEFLYDLTRQKPVKLTISSRPAGISFRKKIEDCTVYVENLGVFISVNYNTTSPSPVEEVQDGKSDSGNDSSKENPQETSSTEEENRDTDNGTSSSSSTSTEESGGTKSSKNNSSSGNPENETGSSSDEK